MKMSRISGKIIRLFFALLVGLFVAGFSSGASTVRASSADVVEISQEQSATQEGSEDDVSNGVFLLLGGMLLIIIAVVITVVASFIVTAPIADEV